jgi:Mrp family chromosome partitioning ATPase
VEIIVSEPAPESAQPVESVPQIDETAVAGDDDAPAVETGGAPPATTRVIEFANQKGGVAKTTTTLNLGVAFREMGYRVLLIDLDPQGNLTMSQGLNPDAIERSMFDVLVHRVPIWVVV